MKIWIGTSGYNYPEWRGSFYPEKYPASKMFSYYAERFSTVEINYTFYRMPNVKTVAGWEAEAPAAFAFALKIPRRISHIARLRHTGDLVASFCDIVKGLGGKLGPILVQLAPSFRKDNAILIDFLQQLPPAFRFAFEFRHGSWLADEVYELLRGKSVALSVHDSEERSTPVVPTADFGYFRLRDAGYNDSDLAAWARRIQDQGSAWKEAFVYFKHEESGIGPDLAKRLKVLLGDARG